MAIFKHYSAPEGKIRIDSLTWNVKYLTLKPGPMDIFMRKFSNTDFIVNYKSANVSCSQIEKGLEEKNFRLTPPGGAVRPRHMIVAFQTVDGWADDPSKTVYPITQNNNNSIFNGTFINKPSSVPSLQGAIDVESFVVEINEVISVQLTEETNNFDNSNFSTFYRFFKEFPALYTQNASTETGFVTNELFKSLYRIYCIDLSTYVEKVDMSSPAAISLTIKLNKTVDVRIDAKVWIIIYYEGKTQIKYGLDNTASNVFSTEV